MPTYSPNMRVCATCVRWGGVRSTDPTRAFVSAQSPTTKGECMGGGHNHAQTPASATCHRYEKWPVLR